MKLMYLKPIPRKAIWGKNKVGKYFGYKDFPENTGQCWCASCHNEASNIILNGPYASCTLHQLWNEHPEVFGNPTGIFPWIIGLVGPSDDLSIQVHPDDLYTKKMKLNDRGKNEGWYFIEASDDSKIVFGHTANSMEEFKYKMDHDEWDQLLRHKQVKKDDFVYVPAKTIHALCKNTIVYEIQQNSNLTYRLYDYKRKDAKGHERELHVKESLSNLNIPFKDYQPEASTLFHGKNEIRKIVSNDSFELTLLKIKDNEEYAFNKSYGVLSILGGQGCINGQTVQLGDHLLIPYNTEKLIFSGELLVILCNEK